jgi:hypothetical protein
VVIRYQTALREPRQRVVYRDQPYCRGIHLYRIGVVRHIVTAEMSG